MARNLDRRVEAVAPTEDPQVKEQLEKVLNLYIADSGAWHMNSEGNFQQQLLEGERKLAQQELMQHWRGGFTAAS